MSVAVNERLLNGGRGTLTVRRAEEGDVPVIVVVHLAAFRGYMNTMLGRPYLRSFYRWFMSVKQGCVLVAVREGRVAGVVAGAEVGYSAQMNRDLLWTGIRGIALHPRVWVHPRLRRNLRARLALLGRRSVTDAEGEEPQGKGFSLVAIAVAPELRGMGAGKELVEAFEAEARNRDADYVRLSVYDTNDAARHVYERQGWTIHSHDDGVVEYVKRLRD